MDGLRRRSWLLGENLPGEPEGLDAGGHAGVDRDLDQGLLQLLHGAAVAHRATEVQLEFLAAVQRGEQAQVVEASLPIRQRVTRPDRAPAELRQDRLPLGVEFGCVGERPIDVLRADAWSSIRPPCATGAGRSRST